MTIFLRAYQEDAVKALLSYFVSNPGKRPLISAPTGSGKSVIQAGFIQKVLTSRPDLRIVVVTHVAELLLQNCDKVMKMMPEMASKIGFYCESLSEKKIEQITFASIQSIFRKGLNLPKVNILLIDEAHLIPKKDTSMYQSFIADLKTINPNLGMAGLSATCFRTDSGLLTSGDNKIFDDICYDIPIRDLIEKGYHARLISKPSCVQADLSNVKVRGGDYILKDLEDVMNDQPLVTAAVNEMITYASDRKKWLVFCAGISHARNVRDEIRSRGVTCEMVYGEMPKTERAEVLKGFKNGTIKAITNYGVLTTGYDEPGIDMVALVRGTKSAGLYMQMVGRGARPLEDKANCMILDFGGNIERFGPVDCIRVRKQGERAKIERMPTRKCPECGNILSISEKFCPCGFEFVPITKDPLATASSRPIINEPVWFEVNDVRYRRHRKRDGGTDSFRVDYICDGGINTISEFVCLEHNGYPRHKAFLWWYDHVKDVWEEDLPTVETAVLRQGLLKRPKRLQAVMENKFWRILKTEYLKDGEEAAKTYADQLEEDYGINL